MQARSVQQAVYDKLKRVEPRVSAALVRETAGELQLLLEKSKNQREDVVPGYHTFVIDGKTYNPTEHRLKEARGDNRAPLPGRSIAMLDTRYELFVDVECEEFAYRCERKILVPMADRLQKDVLYLADRNFSDGPVISRFLEAQAYFIIRQHGASPSWRPVSDFRACNQRDAKGGKVSEREVEIKLPNGRLCRFRQVNIQLSESTRKGDKTIVLLTNLPDSISMVNIANAYRQRWKIETCLGYLAQALNAEINTLCYPAAANLCFCLALTLFNIMSTIKSLLKAYGKPPKTEFDVSYYYVAQEIERCVHGMEIAIPEEHWESYARMTIHQFHRFLVKVAKNAQLERYRKNVRGPKKKPPKRKFNGKKRHVATQSYLDARAAAMTA